MLFQTGPLPFSYVEKNQLNSYEGDRAGQLQVQVWLSGIRTYSFWLTTAP